MPNIDESVPDDASLAQVDPSLKPVKYTFQQQMTGQLFVHFGEQVCLKGGAKLLWHQTAEIEELGEIGAKLAQGILAIDGVETLTPSRQSFEFTISAMADLDHIANKIEELVEQVFQPRPTEYVDPPDDPITKLSKDLQGMMTELVQSVGDQLNASNEAGDDKSSQKTGPSLPNGRQIGSLEDYQEQFRRSFMVGMQHGIEGGQGKNPFIDQTKPDSDDDNGGS